jgi:hypothetical protein
MTDRELMQQALDALNHVNVQDRVQIITALRARLEQPGQEPFEYWNAVEGWVNLDEVRQHFKSVGCGTIYKTAGEGRVPLYNTHRGKDNENDASENILTNNDF